MNIDRHNYENFFLLYADGELSSAENEAVEKFVAVNPDLKGELEILLSAVLKPDEIVFTDKEALLKIDSAIQEKMLLLLDNELPLHEAENLQHRISNDPFYEKEWQVLSGTKLTGGDKISYPDKELLYRREKDSTSIFRMLPWALAAMLVGAGIWISLLLFTGKNETSVAVAPAPAGIKIQQKLPDTEPILPAENTIEAYVALTEKKETRKREEVSATQNNIAGNGAKTNSNNVPAADIQEDAQKELIKESIVSQKSNLSVKPEDIYEKVPDNNEQIAAVKKEEPQINESNAVPNAFAYAQTASFNESSGNRIFYMDEEDVKRSKAAGLVKKLKRFVERTAQIKPGNSLRIAGFEFKGG